MINQRLNMTEIQRYLDGVRFPLDKAELIAAAQSKSAPAAVISVLQRMPDKKYGSLTRIEEEFGKMR